jgi:hypothetical protein
MDQHDRSLTDRDFAVYLWLRWSGVEQMDPSDLRYLV